MKKYLLIFSLLYNLSAFADKLKILVIDQNPELVQFLEQENYAVKSLNLREYTGQILLNMQKWHGAPIAQWVPEHQKVAFRLYRFLIDKDYDVIFFPEYKGYGYYLTEAKKQGYGFDKTVLVSYVTEPSEWLWDISNIIVPESNSYLQADSEQKSVEQADIAIVPSNFAYNILRNKGWNFPINTKILLPLYDAVTKDKIQNNIIVTNSKIKEIVFIAPCNFRNGYDLFVKTVQKACELNPELMKEIKITILHKESLSSNGINSLNLDQDLPNVNYLNNVDYIDYIKDPERLVVFTSRGEFSSDREYAALYEGARFIGMNDGFLAEILKDTNMLVPHLNSSALAQKLVDELGKLSEVPKPKKSLTEVHNQWKKMLKEIEMKVKQPLSHPPIETPFVSVCITHFNRPEQLMEALNGFDKQTYKNFEVIVMDDGSRPAVRDKLKEEIEPFMQKRGWRIFYQENQFISNARNNLVSHAKGPLILLFEDDDTPIPDTIERFVSIKQKTRADIVNTNLAVATKDKFHADKLWLIPGSEVTSIIGKNYIGCSAISLMSKELFQQLSGYLDSYGFLYSDYEFYLRAAMNNTKIVTSLEPTYIYNFVGQHYINDARSAKSYQARTALSAYMHGLPKKFRNIPFWLYSIQQENEHLIKENRELQDKIKKRVE